MMPKPLPTDEARVKFFVPLTVTESGRTALTRVTAVLVAASLNTTSKPSV